MKKNVLWLIVLKVALLFLALSFSDILLGPDEAQYWTWSQKLAIGYYSKPPFIAWQIWLGTVLVGDIEFGVRIVSVIISLLQVALIYELAISMKFSAKAAFWSACLMAFTPLGFFGGYFALTDGGMLLCWTLASILVVKAIERQKFASPWALGFVVLLGSLFKWSIYLIWGVIFLFLHFFTTVKNWKGKFFLAFFISLFGLLPSLIWNMEHDFATFRHTTAIVTGGHADVKGLFNGNFWQFIGAQVALFSPLLFGLLIIAAVNFYQNFASISLSGRFAGFAFALISAAFLLLALFQKVQGNWMVFAYSYAVIILAWYFVDHINQHIWLKAGLFISVLFLLFVFLTPSLAGNFSKSPFKHNLGWPELNQLLKKLEFDENRNFLISDKYQISSISSFYNPAKKLSYFLNLRGSRRNQFCYWPSYQLAEKDKVGYFLWVENQPYLDKELLPAEQFYVSELPKYFETVEKLGFFPLITEKKRVVKGVLIFKCQGIKELQPKDSTLF